jgi:hypothetical protein
MTEEKKPAGRQGRQMSLWLSDEEWDGLTDLMGRTGNSRSDEVRSAIRRHLSAPPAVVVTVPELPPAAAAVEGGGDGA